MSFKKRQSVLLPAFAGAACLCASANAQSVRVVSGQYVTPAAAAQQRQICPHGSGYPQASQWAGDYASPASATAGQPLIEQYRAGALIASYTSFNDQPTCGYKADGTDWQTPGPPAASGCGPFTRSHSFRLWAPGDTFLVYPAVYTGPYNQPYIGPEYDSAADFDNGISHTPDGITIQGVVQNNTRPVIKLEGYAVDNTLGQAPVYFATSTGVTMDSINVTAGAPVVVGKAGVYDAAASNLTLSNMRINGFERSDANGLFGAGGYSGTLTLTGLELDHNGGPNGPAHNAYIGASMTDPGFTVVMSHSWSHSAFYGHLFKTRAQRGVFIANYFDGGVPQRGHTQAENYLLDVPNGGQIAVRNNIFVKNASGPNSNAISLTFLLEGMSDARPQGLDVENNTFVTFARAYDGVHVNFPMAFLEPSVTPGTSDWPADIPARVIKNAFVGYCTASVGGITDYRGDASVIESFTDMTRTYAFSTKAYADDATMATLYEGYVPEIGTLAYSRAYLAQLHRRLSTLGALD